MSCQAICAGVGVAMASRFSPPFSLVANACPAAIIPVFFRNSRRSITAILSIVFHEREMNLLENPLHITKNLPGLTDYLVEQ